MSLPKLHTLEEVAAATGLSIWKLRRGCQGDRPRLTHVRSGKTPLMTDEHVTAAIAAMTRSGDTTEPKPDPLAATRERVIRRQRRRSAA